MELYRKIIQVLEPYMGKMLAETCVRGTALTLGKSSDTLSRSDIPLLEPNIKKYLAGVAGQGSIEKILKEIREI